MIKQLIKVASELDAAGFTKEADQVDAIIKKIAGNVVFPPKPPTRNVEWIKVTSEKSFEQICQNYSSYSPKPLAAQVKEQAELNTLNIPGFDPNNIRRGQTLVVYSPGVSGP